MFRRFSSAALVLGLFVSTAVGQSQRKDKPPEGDLPVFDGAYTISTGERDGRSIPEDHFVGSTVTVTRDRIVGVDKNKKEFLDVRYAVDTAAKPWVIRMKATLPVSGETTGLIEKDRDTVRIIYALPDAPAPSDFRTKDKQIMLTLREAKRPGGVKTYEPTIKK